MKKKLVIDDEGMVSDYESEPEMSEEYVLKYLEIELGNSREALLVNFLKLRNSVKRD